ncbi:MAG: hypothetical protein IJX51_07825 [Clostridia bacterium]|nr:hypothetical protein [Clostridia bacterium]
MEFYFEKVNTSLDKKIVADDMLLTKGIPTTAGSRMLDGYVSLFEAEVLTRLTNAGYGLCGKASVGELAIDLLGETSYKGACVDENGKILNPVAEIIKSGDAMAGICLDANGYVRRAAAQYGLVSVKPTYGTVSRFGMIPVACSGDCVSVMAESASACRDILDAMAGHDDKDGTSLPESKCALLKKSAPVVEIKRVAVITDMLCCDDTVNSAVNSLVAKLEADGIKVDRIENDLIKKSRNAWNILMSAELCNNVSRYDGVKYGYRSNNFTSIDELYTNSRTEAFGDFLKAAILFGSDTLSTENYMRVYDKALRVRRLICEEFGKLFKEYDAVLMPACSAMAYSIDAVRANKDMPYTENLYTAPASITGLPAVAFEGVQLICNYFNETSLLALCEKLEKEGK